MRQKRFGRTNLEISELSLGTVELGLDYGIANGGEPRRPSEEEACALLHFTLDRGINLIDTARAYGEAERIIGRALKGRRHEYLLITKVLPRPGQPLAVRSQVEESLVALQTDYIEIVMIHCRAEQNQPDLETLEELDKFRKQGKIRFIGCSVYGPEAAMDCVLCGLFDCIEVGYSALDRRIEPAVLGAAESKDIGVIARSVLLKGALSERYRYLPESFRSLKQCVEKLAQIAGSAARLPEVAYRYVCGRLPPHSALIGTANRTEIEACIGFLELGSLSAEEISAVRSVRLDNELWLNPGSWPPYTAGP